MGDYGTHCQTVRHFLREARRFPKAVFRGQTRDYGSLIPSLFRSKFDGDHESMDFLFSEDSYSNAYADFERELEHLRNKDTGSPSLWAPEPWWEEKKGLFSLFPDLDLSGLPSSFGPGHGFGESSAAWAEAWAERPPILSSDVVARLQHYGVPTVALDVSFDPLIALWFATHEFVSTGARAGYYVRNSESGVVYILQIPSERLYDLRRNNGRPIGGLRGVRQQGGLLTATREQPDVIGFAVKTLTVGPNILLADSFLERSYNSLFARNLRTLNQHFLFPTPSEDPFYSFLISAKHGRKDEVLKEFKPFRKEGNTWRYVPDHERTMDEKLRMLLDWITEFDSPPPSPVTNLP